MAGQMNKKPQFGAIYTPKVNYRGGERHPSFGEVKFIKFDTEQEMHNHIRNSVREADCYEYIRYDVLTVDVKVTVQ